MAVAIRFLIMELTATAAAGAVLALGNPSQECGPPHSLWSFSASEPVHCVVVFTQRVGANPVSLTGWNQFHKHSGGLEMVHSEGALWRTPHARWRDVGS
jgi:hypothetical protein